MPMLMKGNVYHKRQHKMTFPCAVETKHDEIRCHVRVFPALGTFIETPGWVEFLSYAGKPLANMQQFAAQFQELADGIGYYEFDCGFEVKGNFNDSYRWVRSTKGVPINLVFAPTRFYLYDLPTSNACYVDRRMDVLAIVDRVDWLYAALDSTAETHEDVVRIYQHYLELGYEGAMVKNLTHKYQRTRTDDWLKLKPSEDADGKIVGLVEAVCGKDQPDLGLRVGDRLGRVGSIEVACEDGSTATPFGIDHDLGRDMLRNPQDYLGKWCEFKYMERDRQGGYRHPTFHRIREDKQ